MYMLWPRHRTRDVIVEFGYDGLFFVGFVADLASALDLFFSFISLNLCGTWWWFPFNEMGAGEPMWYSLLSKKNCQLCVHARRHHVYFLINFLHM